MCLTYLSIDQAPLPNAGIYDREKELGFGLKKEGEGVAGEGLTASHGEFPVSHLNGNEMKSQVYHT